MKQMTCEQQCSAYESENHSELKTQVYLTVVAGVMERSLLVATPILLGSYRSVGGRAAACPNCWMKDEEWSVSPCELLIKVHWTIHSVLSFLCVIVPLTHENKSHFSLVVSNIHEFLLSEPKTRRAIKSFSDCFCWPQMEHWLHCVCVCVCAPESHTFLWPSRSHCGPETWVFGYGRHKEAFWGTQRRHRNQTCPAGPQRCNSDSLQRFDCTSYQTLNIYKT